MTKSIIGAILGIGIGGGAGLGLSSVIDDLNPMAGLGIGGAVGGVGGFVLGTYLDTLGAEALDAQDVSATISDITDEELGEDLEADDIIDAFTEAAKAEGLDDIQEF